MCVECQGGRMDMTIDSMALSHKINVTLPQVHTGKELFPFLQIFCCEERLFTKIGSGQT